MRRGEGGGRELRQSNPSVNLDLVSSIVRDARANEIPLISPL